MFYVYIFYSNMKDMKFNNFNRIKLKFINSFKFQKKIDFELKIFMKKSKGEQNNNNNKKQQNNKVHYSNQSLFFSFLHC